MAALVGVLALTALSPAVAQSKKPFKTDDVTGAFEEPASADPDKGTMEEPGGEIERASFGKTGTLVRLCGCTNDEFDFQPESLDNIRAFSDKFMSDGDTKSLRDLSNLVWAHGQALDHDLVATVDEVDGEEYYITLTDKTGAKTDSRMTVHRLEVETDPDGSQCRMPIVINTPLVDASHVYGSDEEFLQNVLREPDSCYLRSSPGDLLPITTNANDAGQHFMVAGDARVNEHGLLATMHTLWMREHNRVCDSFEKKKAFRDLSADDAFDKARKIVIAKWQHITLEHFLPALGIPKQLVRYHVPKIAAPDISVEFSLAYRLGHDFIPDTIGDFDVRELFDGEKFMGIGASADGSDDNVAANERIDALLQACADNPANEVDGKFSDAIRDTLFGSFGEDLASRNLFRSRETGLPGYDDLAKCFGVPPDKKVTATTNDSLLGLLYENKFTGFKVLGPTLERIVTDQFHRLFFGVGGHYWVDDDEHVDAVKGYVNEIKSCTLASVINDNTGAKISGNGFVAGPGLFSNTPTQSEPVDRTTTGPSSLPPPSSSPTQQFTVFSKMFGN